MLKKTKSVVNALLGNPIEPIQRDFAASKVHVQEVNSTLQSRLDHLRKDRGLEQQDTLEEDFQRVLDAWGMREKDIPRVISDLYLRAAVMCVPALLALFTLFSQPVSSLSSPLLLVVLVLLLLASIMGVLVTLWRISILRRRQFTPFSRALARFFSKKPA